MMESNIPNGIFNATELYRSVLRAGRGGAISQRMDVAKILQAIMEKRAWTQDDLADHLRTTQASISRYLNGDRVPNGPIMLSIWGLAEEDGLLKSAGLSERQSANTLETTGAFSGFSLVPRYAVHAGAGNGRMSLVDRPSDLLAFKTEWLHDLGIMPDHAGLITAAGDSMSPTIPDGALLLVDLREGQALRNGCLYIVVIDGDLLVKRLSRRVDGTVELISDNPAYPREVVAIDHVGKLNIPGRVVWIGHSV